MASELDVSARFRNFDWEKTKTFYYVFKLGNFTNAARFLNISQSALSRQILALEQNLGCPLFSRHSNGLKLTRKGEELASAVEKFFLDMRGFTYNTHVKMDNSKRKIRIASSHAVISYILSDLIIEYNKAHPELIFELIGEDQLIDIVLNDVDIAIRPLDINERKLSNEQGVQQEYLFSLEKKLYASIGYLEKYGEPQTVEDLKNHHILAHANPDAYPYSNLNWILTLGMPEGKLHQPIFTSNSVECAIDAAKNDMGIIGIYEEMKIVRNANLKNILPDIKDKEIEDYIIYPDYLKEDPEIIKLKKYLKEKLSSKNKL